MKRDTIISINREKISEEYSKSIGKRIADVRKDFHLSQRELGEMVYVKKDVIRRLENGERRILDHETLVLIESIANNLSSSSDYFLGIKDTSLHFNEKLIPATDLPEYTHSPDRFIYSNGLSTDMAYIAEYMHKEFQKEIADMIHSFVELHKCAVHYPNVSKETASSLSHNQLLHQRELDFFNSIKKE